MLASTKDVFAPTKIMIEGIVVALVLGMCRPDAEWDIFNEPQENRWEIILNEDEIELLAIILELEAGGESDYGKDAVVEVIFNRMRDNDFPNTLEEVLKEEGQFTTWEYRNDGIIPSQESFDSVYYVLCGWTYILPYETVYFSRKAQNERIELEIEGHVFCNK